jgi:hypothetical protein
LRELVLPFDCAKRGLDVEDLTANLMETKRDRFKAAHLHDRHHPRSKRPVKEEK